MPANVETIFYVREKPWHGLGTRIEEAPASADALIYAGLDWNVVQKNVSRLAEEVSLPPGQIREATGLTPEQFKEAKKHRTVQDYFKNHIRTSGSGKNTVYTKTGTDTIRPAYSTSA